MEKHNKNRDSTEKHFWGYVKWCEGTCSVWWVNGPIPTPSNFLCETGLAYYRLPWQPEDALRVNPRHWVHLCILLISLEAILSSTGWGGLWVVRTSEKEFLSEDWDSHWATKYKVFVYGPVCQDSREWLTPVFPWERFFNISLSRKDQIFHV